jgi:hypothetical protein
MHQTSAIVHRPIGGQPAYSENNFFHATPIIAYASITIFSW